MKSYNFKSYFFKGLIPFILIGNLFLFGCGEKLLSPFDESVRKQITFNFKDQDPDQQEITGEIKLILPNNFTPENFSSYVLYWANAPQPEDKTLKITEISLEEIENDILYLVPEDTKIQGSYVLLYLKDANTEVYSGLSLKINDVIEGEESQTEDNTWLNGLKLPISYFEFDKAKLSNNAKNALKKAVAEIKYKEKIRFLITGHTDERGSNEYNLALGEQRAIVVAEYLIALGINEHNIKTISYGEEKPVNSESTVEAWRSNRRAEIVILPLN